ncbi:hypothetical protein PHYBLDRAFT_151305 [Phycomyces blakesleeanus NRRL 1555(-)]|uniref:Uncharacterized protein n=1 Tax=Phycomyces blakesleeanus (strain ATCC 8743b / DSM 1359 / FGSC 10004 / NBRC 33097 / NRRL 1555) TaxID=763407 RepID=A0A167KCR7_PHYB8|nr:hypothetical protein PHYBLDRAFT_151305 [Phycomyces blakesleeanus NRRL 1555(-)]OAD67776.1 hypothetical protein PHYBLDRAFT_151305 [Phycomyces blakesleeanus NRRL 1555(-)]|eukprot:XP_018285816.1 hypothetical protein PHYBLDRAFT_151305 [Phycomyces blakesleeanus NRRL 1555(-)]
MTNSLAILHHDMTTVMKDVADIKAKTLNTPVSAVFAESADGFSACCCSCEHGNELNYIFNSLPRFNRDFFGSVCGTLSSSQNIWLEFKPRWNTAVNFNQSPTTELTENLVTYLERNFVGAGLRKSDVRDFVYMNFTSKKRAANKSQAKKKSDNARNRKSSHEKEHLKRCKTAYQSNKTAINDEMKRDCSGLIIEEAMSVGESDDVTSPHVSYSALCLRHPGWRSDEYNHFITLVDNKVVADLGLNSHQLRSRAFGETVEGSVPDAIVSQFPQWALRNGP